MRMATLLTIMRQRILRDYNDKWTADYAQIYLTFLLHEDPPSVEEKKDDARQIYMKHISKKRQESAKGKKRILPEDEEEEDFRRNDGANDIEILVEKLVMEGSRACIWMNDWWVDQSDVRVEQVVEDEGDYGTYDPVQEQYDLGRTLYEVEE